MDDYRDNHQKNETFIVTIARYFIIGGKYPNFFLQIYQ